MSKKDKGNGKVQRITANNVPRSAEEKLMTPPGPQAPQGSLEMLVNGRNIAEYTDHIHIKARFNALTGVFIDANIQHDGNVASTIQVMNLLQNQMAGNLMIAAQGLEKERDQLKARLAEFEAKPAEEVPAK